MTTVKMCLEKVSVYDRGLTQLFMTFVVAYKPSMKLKNT